MFGNVQNICILLVINVDIAYVCSKALALNLMCGCALPLAGLDEGINHIMSIIGPQFC